MRAAGLEILAAAWVVPVVGRPLRDGRVAVGGGRVAWVGRAGESGEPEGSLRALGDGVLMPGLVNAHCHLELSWLRGRIAVPQDFVGWIRAVVEARQREDPQEARARAGEAIRSMEALGTVAVGDVSNALGHLDLLAASSLEAVVFHELLGWDPDKASSILQGARARLASLPRSLAAGGVVVRLAAHGPHSASPALLRALVEHGGPAAIHLAESPAESRFLASGEGEWAAFLRERGLGAVAFEPPGRSPVRYVDELGGLRPGLVAAHCVQASREDRRLLAERRVHVALCPRSNRNLEVGLAPVPELLEAGVRLCLGTDSLASADSLDLMEDVALLRRQFPDVAPAALLRMATLGGAEALGLPHLGAIAPGKRAALAYAPADRAPEDPLAFLVSGEARLERVAA